MFSKRFLAILALTWGVAACGADDGTTRADTSVEADVTDTAATDTAMADTGVEDTTDTSAADTTDATDTAVAADTSTTDTSVANPEVEFTIVAKGIPVDITPDGLWAIFWDAASTTGDVYIYNISTKTLTLETAVGTPQRDFPTAISSTLEITALYGEPVVAGLWTQANEWRDLGSLYADGCGEVEGDPTRGDLGGAWDISADGKVVVGMLWNDCSNSAFRWSDDGTTTDFRHLAILGEVPEGALTTPSNRATVVSDDGKVAGGFAQTQLVDRWPALWNTDDATGQLLTTTEFPADAPGEILAISTDGKAACGVWNQNGFVWTEAGGVVATGALDGVLPGEPTFANAIANDGALVFGASGGGAFGTPQAFVWSPTKGMRRLVDVARAAGANIAETLILGNVLGASADGTALIGTLLNAQFEERPFILRLPASAYTD